MAVRVHAAGYRCVRQGGSVVSSGRVSCVYDGSEHAMADAARALALRDDQLRDGLGGSSYACTYVAVWTSASAGLSALIQLLIGRLVLATLLQVRDELVDGGLVATAALG